MMRAALLALAPLLTAGRAAAQDGAEPPTLSAVFDEREAVCSADGGRLWGVSLCGPILFVDAAADRIYADRPADGLVERDGVWEGARPAALLEANTAQVWGGTRWTTVLLPLPDDAVGRRELLLHESFHRVQDDLGLAAREGRNAHLETEAGRVWLRLEARALARALAGDEADGVTALRDALLFRARRQALDPDAAAGERDLELQEGLPSYTGTVLATENRDAAVERAIQGLADLERRDAFARSFAYATGPALGLLADRHAPGWRRAIGAQKDLAGLLADAIGFAAGPAADQAERRAAAYGAKEVRAQEAERAVAAERTRSGYRARLVEGPVLVLPLREMRMSFDPNAVVPLGDEGTVYPSMTLQDRWGTLTVNGQGVLIAPDFTRAAVGLGAPGACAAEGDGWRLDLAPDWSSGAGPRPGDCGLVRPDPPAGNR